jgi:hypothetical protein
MGRKQSPSPFWRSRSRSASAPATPRGGAAAPADPPLGCMSMVQYLIFAPGAGCVGRPPSSSSSNPAFATIVEPNYNHDKRRSDVEAVHKQKEKRGGFDAPRNSLDLDADNLNDIQVGLPFLGSMLLLATAAVHPS